MSRLFLYSFALREFVLIHDDQKQGLFTMLLDYCRLFGFFCLV